MKSGRLITRRRAKWVGVVVSLPLMFMLIGSNWYSFTVTRNGSQGFEGLRIAAGLVTIDRARMADPILTPGKGVVWTRMLKSGIVWFRFEWKTSTAVPPDPMGSYVFIVFPIWMPLLLVALPTFWLWRVDRRVQPWQCAKCRYDLRGLEGGGDEGEDAVCPECGEAITASGTRGSG